MRTRASSDGEQSVRTSDRYVARVACSGGSATRAKRRGACLVFVCLPPVVSGGFRAEDLVVRLVLSPLVVGPQSVRVVCYINTQSV